jgi:hypothetical protein
MPVSRGILFLHIPKTAGTSLKRYLYHQFPAGACLLDPFESADGRQAEPDHFALTAGHVDYDYVRRYQRRPFVLTCLRQPVDRALSAYYYQREPRLALEIRSLVPRMGAAAEEVLADLARLNRYATLADFLDHEPELARKTLGNIQTRYLAGATAADKYADDPEHLLAIALDHLRACEGILLTERLTETLATVASTLGFAVWGPLEHHNATAGSRPTAEHEPAVLAALADLTRLDAELYRVADQLVECPRQAELSPALARAELPSAADFTFDQPIHGRGWHVREHGERGWFAWTDREAVLHLGLETVGDHILECTVEHASCWEAWQDLEISVNGNSLALLTKPDVPPGTIAVSVPAEVLCGSSGRMSVGLRVRRVVRPIEQDPSSPDARPLGVAVSRVRVRRVD